MSQYIIGKIKPKLSTIISMAKILNTTTDYLLDLTNNPNPSDFSLNEKENNLINNYRNLSEIERLQVEAYIQAINDKKNY